MSILYGKEMFLPDHDFWCFDFKVDCSEAEIASAYSQFTKN